MFTKLIAAATVSLAALTTSAVAEGTWAEAIAKAEAYEITTGEKGYWVRGKHSNAAFRQFAGASGFMFGNVFADDVVLPHIKDVRKVLEAIEAGAKPIIVASNDWILPSNVMLCEIAAQLEMDCALFTEMFYRYTAKDENGNYDSTKAVSNLEELEASVVAQVEALGIELDVTENGVSIDALNAAIAALEADAITNAATITVLEAQVEALKADASVDADKIAELNVDLAAAIAKQVELQAFLDTSEGKLLLANAAKDTAEAEIVALEAEIATMEDDYAILQGVSTEGWNSFFAEETAHGQTAAKLLNAEGLLAQSKAAKALVDTALADANQEITDLTTEKTNLTNSVTALENQVKHMAAKILNAEDVIFATQNAADFLEANFGIEAATITTFDEATAYIKAMPQDVFDVYAAEVAKNTALTNDLNVANSSVATLTKEVADQVIELNDLTNDLKVANGKIAGLKIQLDEALDDVEYYKGLYNDKYADWEEALDDLQDAQDAHQAAELVASQKGALLVEAKAKITTLNGTIAELNQTIADLGTPVEANTFSIIEYVGGNSEEVNVGVNAIYQELKAANSNEGDTVTISGDLHLHPTINKTLTEGTDATYVFTGDSWKKVGNDVNYSVGTKSVSGYDFVSTHNAVVHDNTSDDTIYYTPLGDIISSGKIQITKDDVLVAVIAWQDFAVSNGKVEVSLDHLSLFANQTLAMIQDLETEIAGAYTAGYDDGYNEGFKDGYATGYADGKAGNEYAE